MYNDKVVTGSSNGIGKAIAREYAKKCTSCWNPYRRSKV